MKKLIFQIKSVLASNKHIITFIMTLFIIGLIIGSLFTIFLSTNDQSYILNQIGLFFNNIKNNSSEVYGIIFFKKDILNNLMQIIVIYLLGLSVIGILIIIFIIIFKGFTLGMTISGILLKYKLKGVVAVILYIFPVCFLKILVYVFATFFGIITSLKFARGVVKKDQINYKTFLGKYLVSFIISILFISILSLLDSYLTPILLKLFIYIK